MERREQPSGSSVCHCAHRHCCLHEMDVRNVLPQQFKGWFGIAVDPREDACLGWRTEIFHRVCVLLLFHVETDSVPPRVLKIAYGNVFLLSHSFCSALHLLDFTFSTKRSSHYLFSENNFCFCQSQLNSLCS